MAQTAIHLWRDNLSSIAYSEQLNSAKISAFLQRTDRRYGILGQKPSGFQRILCECSTESSTRRSPDRAFQEQRPSSQTGDDAPKPLSGIRVVGNRSRSPLA